MHFAIDEPAPPPAPAPAKAVNPPSPAATEVSASEVLLESKPIRTDGLKKPKNRVIVLLKDTFQDEADDLFIRYAVRNGTREAYTLGTPQVVVINVNGSPQGVDQLPNTQLTESAAARIKAANESPVEVIGGKLRSVRVEPGQETVGVVSVKLPAKGNAQTVLRLIFPRDAQGQPTATMVL
jgi:hypothetical protein